MSLTILPVTLPRSLVGVQNGQLPASMLEQVGPRGFLHPNAARCWRALCAEGRTFGYELTYTYGGCYRPYADQRNLFTSRYQVTPLPGRPTKVWEGVVWYQKPQTAMAAVPGTSNHGLGLAVDAALDSDLSDGVGPDDATSIGPALPWFREAALRYGFSFEAQSEPWHIRLVVGDVVPAAVLAYEASLLPPEPPPVVVPPTAPQPPKVKRMFVCVGNENDKSDPRRWAYNGSTCRLLADERDYNEIGLFWGWVGSSLTAPHWKPLAWITALEAA